MPEGILLILFTRIDGTLCCFRCRSADPTGIDACCLDRKGAGVGEETPVGTTLRDLETTTFFRKLGRAFVKPDAASCTTPFTRTGDGMLPTRRYTEGKRKKRQTLCRALAATSLWVNVFGSSALTLFHSYPHTQLRDFEGCAPTHRLRALTRALRPICKPARLAQ